MIANITTGSFTNGMVMYNHNKTKDGKEATLLGVENIPSEELNDITKSIESRNKLNENISKPNIHISLNFHKNDIINNEEIYQIANDYMKEMGYENQPFAIYRHFDKEHPHVHIVSTQINEDGKKINDSYLYRKSQRITRELEKKYNITVATEQQGNKVKNLPLETLIHEHLEHGKHSLTGVLSKIIEEALGEKPTTEKEFDYALEKHQVKRTFNEKEGNRVGHIFHLMTFEELGDNNLAKNNLGIPGQELDTSFGLNSVMRQIEINAEVKKEGLKNMMGKVYSVINNIEDSKNLTELAVELRKKGIVLEAKRKQSGDDINGIYALNFKETKSGIRYSASDLKLKTKDFLKKINDNEKFQKRKENSNIVYIDKPEKQNHSNDKTYSSHVENKTLLEQFIKVAESFIETENVQDHQEDLSRKKRRRGKRR